jgi:quercetin dioxygenase-like cupin family protein
MVGMRAGVFGCAGLAALLLQAAAARAFDAPEKVPPAIVTPLASAEVTATGQPITLPGKDVQVLAWIYEIAPGATLAVHKHPFARYAYVLAGNLRVTNVETGRGTDYKTGDFIVEMIGQWHQGTNTGAEPLRLLVIDQVEKGSPHTVVRD